MGRNETFPIAVAAILCASRPNFKEFQMLIWKPFQEKRKKKDKKRERERENYFITINDLERVITACLKASSVIKLLKQF